MQSTNTVITISVLSSIYSTLVKTRVEPKSSAQILLRACEKSRFSLSVDAFKYNHHAVDVEKFSMENATFALHAQSTLHESRARYLQLLAKQTNCDDHVMQKLVEIALHTSILCQYPQLTLLKYNLAKSFMEQNKMDAACEKYATLLQTVAVNMNHEITVMCKSDIYLRAGKMAMFDNCAMLQCYADVYIL